MTRSPWPRKGEASIEQIARDVGISESCLARWLKIADREDGLAPPASGDRGGGSKMESFFALLQRNVLDRQRWTTREDLRLVIITWIEETYYRRRRQRRLGRLTPIKFETLTQAAHAA